MRYRLSSCVAAVSCGSILIQSLLAVRWKLRLGLGLALLSLLSACSGALTYSTASYVEDVAPWQVYGAPEGEALVEIRGNPFAAPAAQLERAILASMENSLANGLPFRFATHSSRARPGWRFLLLFGVPPTLNSASICVKSQETVIDPAQRPLLIQAAYCAGDRLLAESAGRIAAPKGPDDPVFHALIGRLTFDLTPSPVKSKNEAD
jgi:hypothetical protein